MIGGCVGTKVMEQVYMKLYELKPEEDRRREEDVRPGPPYEIAAKKMTETPGIEFSEEQLQKVAMYGFHYGLGMGWGPTYTFFRRWTDLNPVSAGLLSGAARLPPWRRRKVRRSRRLARSSPSVQRRKGTGKLAPRSARTSTLSPPGQSTSAGRRRTRRPSPWPCRQRWRSGSSATGPVACRPFPWKTADAAEIVGSSNPRKRITPCRKS